MSTTFRSRGKGKNRKIYPISSHVKFAYQGHENWLPLDSRTGASTHAKHAHDLFVEAGLKGDRKQQLAIKRALVSAGNKAKAAGNDDVAKVYEMTYKDMNMIARQQKREQIKKGAISVTTTNEAVAVMREREKAMLNEDYNGYTNHDTWNTMLLLENTQESDRWLNNWSINWKKKIKGGRFNPEEAEKAVATYIIPAAKGKKSLQWAVGRDFTPDPDIDASKVNKAEIVRMILEREG